MSVRRALLNCAVLSLQDSCVFYPCCKGCFSRIHAEKGDSNRFRCPNCGYWCHKDRVDHRYRLSLRVLGDGCIFGVTVFGSSLNRFFGVHANELQRLAESLDGSLDQQTKSALLVKAVKDCFIGQYFLFGLKFNETGSEPWCQRPPPDSFNRGKRSQFIASLMLPPTPEGPAGCTVFSYYQVLLQNASESQPSNTGKRSRLPFRSPKHNQISSNDSPFCISGLLSQSWLRLEEQDSTLTFTPPWEQSLGLVTSSAEQEEPCRNQENNNVTTRQTVDHTEPNPVQKVDGENHKVVSKNTQYFSEESLDKASSFVQCPSFCVGEDFGNSFTTNTWLTHPQPEVNNCSLTQNEFFIEQQHTEACSPDSLAWENCPFSESLNVFLCKDNKDALVGEAGFDVKSCLPEQSEKNAQETKPLTGEGSASKTRSKHSFLCDVTKVPSLNAVGGSDVSDQVSEKCPNTKELNYSLEYDDGEDREAHLSLEQDSYNCSAELFSGSFISSVGTDDVAVETATDAYTHDFNMDQHLMSKKLTNVTNLTPLSHKRRSRKHRNCFNTLITEDVDFVPPSQSTPVMKVKVLPPLLRLHRNGIDKSTNQNVKLSFLSDRQTPEKRMTKKQQYSFLLGMQRTPNLDSKKFFCDEEDGILAPTPAAKPKSNGILRARGFPEKGSSYFTLKRSQEDIDDCKRTLPLTSLNRLVEEKENEEEAVNEESVVEYPDKSHMSDYSRDLFSDSI